MHSLLVTAACVVLSALGSIAGGVASLQSILDSEGIEYFVPGEPGYQNASRAYNLRLHFEPVAVAYPTSTENVSVLVEAAALLGLAGESASQYRRCVWLMCPLSKLTPVRAVIPTLAMGSAVSMATWLLTCRKSMISRWTKRRVLPSSAPGIA